MLINELNYLEIAISLVNGINQTFQNTNQERPCTTTKKIKQALEAGNHSLVLR